MDNQKFDTLNLSANILKSVEASGYVKATPIQQQAIPLILDNADLFACAQTGTGKTAAFVLPIMSLLETQERPNPTEFSALILVPTRELAEQVGANVERYGKFTKLTKKEVYGGVSKVPQVKALANGVDILIATPGRLLDLFTQKKLSFKGLKYLVLDEADRMLDMGFMPDIRRICKQLPRDRQSMLFSATLSKEVEELASGIVRNPQKIMVSPDKPTVEKIAQKICFVDSDKKFDLLVHLLGEHLAKDDKNLALIFCRTKHNTSRLAKRLTSNSIETDCIHGDKAQAARQRALERFKRRSVRVLTATDVAARGIDVKAMSLVINFDLPKESETYVHRIGRTARAEQSGEAISFCGGDELQSLRGIEKLIKKEIEVSYDNPYHNEKIYQKKIGRKNALRMNQEKVDSKKNAFGEKRDSKGNFKKRQQPEKVEKFNAGEKSVRKEKTPREEMGQKESRIEKHERQFLEERNPSENIKSHEDKFVKENKFNREEKTFKNNRVNREGRDSKNSKFGRDKKDFKNSQFNRSDSASRRDRSNREGEDNKKSFTKKVLTRIANTTLDAAVAFDKILSYKKNEEGNSSGNAGEFKEERSIKIPRSFGKFDKFGQKKGSGKGNFKKSFKSKFGGGKFFKNKKKSSRD